MASFLRLVLGHPFSQILLTALLLVAAMPGLLGWWPLVFFALVPLLRLTLVQPPRRCALYGLAAGCIHYLILLYWIVIVLGRYGGLPLALSLFALVLLSLYMALYVGAFFGLVSYLVGGYWHHERSGIPLLVWSAPIVWVGLEWLRGRLFTGLPWMDLGYALYGCPKLIQAADLGGHYLISFCIVLTNSLLVGMIANGTDKDRRSKLCSAGRKVMLFACCVLVFLSGYSFTRYRQVKMGLRRSLQAGITVVQGNIAQDAKWTPAWRQKTVQTYIELSQKALARNISELVVWPETALPFYPTSSALFGDVLNLARKENIFLLAGSPWAEPADGTRGAGNGLSGPEKVRYYNSALLITPEGRLVRRVDKQHLVPFGEYVPLRGLLPFLEPLVENIGDFTAGTSALPLEAGRIRAGVLICFETIFPEIARTWVQNGANLLVVLTNDAWYGRSSAPYHSLAMSVFRAVETRRSLVRAANTGISALVDPLGDILCESKLFVSSYLSATLPLTSERTLFVRLGHNFGAVCFALILPLILYRRATA